MTNTHATSALAWQSELKRARTHRDHGAEEFLVLVAKAAEIVPQTDIAAQLHASQPQVSRWAAKGRVLLTPVQKGKLARSPYHAAQRFSRDEITRDQLVEFLTHWPYLDSETKTEGLHDDLLNVVPESFDDVHAALVDDLIDEDIYTAALEALKAQAAARR